MNSITLRVVKNPKSKTSWLCFPQGLKPFVITKPKAKEVKHPGIYIVDLDINPQTNFVFGIKVWSEVATVKKQKRKK